MTNDVGDFEKGALSERVSALLADQRRRWREGETVLVESYLGENPELRGNAEAALELIVSEMKLRSERGERPPLREYSARFPEYAAQLKGRLEAHAMSTAPSPAVVTRTAAESVEAEPACAGDLPDSAAERLPEKLGRYRVVSRLGTGGFGAVYLGYDEELKRHVAIKVPHARSLGTRRRIDAFLAEARRMARLSHPGIVAVHDVGQDGDLCYIISQFIDGSSLSERMRQGRFHPMEVARIASQVADALFHAHCEGLVHRDVKPANILLDAQGKPHVADFGLAISHEESRAASGSFCGTPPYMAPEQIRGEDHLIGGHTDVYSLGVVIYELLCGRLPFSAPDLSELFAAILEEEPPAPREIDGSIPAELERICLRACSKATCDRHPDAAALAEELRAFMRSASDRSAARPNPSGAAVVPKGLRPFGVEDADFFLDLLPGPRDREGLPESLRFWKRRIESIEESTAFRVGLLFGPSGCGKSSLVRAGLLPRLDPSVVPVYLEATPDDTETRLAAALRGIAPGAETQASLAELFSSIRRREEDGSGKVLIIVDQFEQWLHAHAEGLAASELVRALRQADGVRVQCLLMIRDDFWVAATRLFRALEIRMLEDHNVRLVDLFDAAHARRVLELFGRAYGRLPANPAATTAGERAFLEEAVAGLAIEGRIVSVRLSLFAEMLKDREWTRATLRDAGGMEGVGVAFLERSLGARSGVPEHRAFEKSARAVLEALLPEPSSDIKGVRRSVGELREASGLSRESDRFQRLIEILDRELHILTPVEIEDGGGAPDPHARSESSEAGRFYQLTHDYLVPSVREWVTRRRRETWRGRAELELRARTTEWSRSRESRFLPGFPQYVAISLAVRDRAMTTGQRALMRSAARYHGLRWGSGLVVVALLAALFQLHRTSARLEQAEARVDAVVTAVPAAVPYAIRNLEHLESEAVSILSRRLEAGLTDPAQRLNAGCALAALGDARLDLIIEGQLSAPASADACRNVIAALGPATAAKGLLAHRLASEDDPAARARLAITLLALEEPLSAVAALSISEVPSRRTAFIHGLATWHGDLASLARLLRESRDAAFRSGVCIALGRIDPGSLREEERARLEETLVELYATAPGAGTHSAAGWALGRWGTGLPPIEPSKSSFRGQDWFVNRHGMTMLRIGPGSFTMGNLDDKEREEDPRTPHRVTITRSYFMCDREVWVDLFRTFLAETGAPEDVASAGQPYCLKPDDLVSPGGLHPAQSVSWEQAALFCNWLSRKEGRAPCYQIGESGRTRKAAGGSGADLRWDEWECDFEANGYRLPTEAEWEYACRAGTTSTFYFGNDRSLLPEYGISSSDLKIESLPGATLIPNGWGLFDMHGNVWEWCWDWNRTFPDAREEDPRGPGEPTFDGGAHRVYRGGGIANSRGESDSKARGSASPKECFWNLGFRVVCAE